MAERPIFIPSEGISFVKEIMVPFKWHPGMAPSQKQKNVVELHSAASRIGYFPLLEVSSKSDYEAGQRLSAFSLSMRIGARDVSVECAFQGSKVFEFGGPYKDLYDVTSREAKRDPRLISSGKLVGFDFLGEEFPLTPPTAFYDFLYLNALDQHREWLKRLEKFAGFTDIEFNPARSINCQARSCAVFVSLQRREALDYAVESFGQFLELLNRSN